MRTWTAWLPCTGSRSSGWAFWRAPIPTRWESPPFPSAQLYAADAWQRLANVRFHLRSPVERIDGSGFMVAGERRAADHYICALPFERLEAVGLPAPALEHSPITGVHLWFDREVTTLPHATLLGRTMQWMFNKDRGRYLQLVVSASRDLTNVPRNEIVDIAIGDLRLYFPRVHEANLVKAHVVKEQRATFSAAPGTESLRPTARIRPSQRLSGRRLDPQRLARHHGRRRPQRLPGRRSGGAEGRQTGPLSNRGYRVMAR